MKRKKRKSEACVSNWSPYFRFFCVTNKCFLNYIQFIIDYDGDYFKKESLPLKERVAGYVYQESYFEGQRSSIRFLIKEQENLGLSENQVIKMTMEFIGLIKAEAKQLYDELLADLEK